MRSKCTLMIMAVAAMFLLWACSSAGSTDGGDDGGNDGGSDSNCLTIGGNGGSATIDTTAENKKLATAESTAMNVLDSKGSPVSDRMHPAVAASSCGDVAGIFLDPESDELMYIDLTAGSDAESIMPDANFSNSDVALVFDTACTPMILTTLSDEGLVSYSPDENGVWQQKILAPSPLSDDYFTPGIFVTKTASDGSLAVFAHGGWDDDMVGALWTSDGTPGADWTGTMFVPPVKDRIYDYALGDDGSIHAVYPPKNVYPCDPCDLDLYYAHRESDGSWNAEVIQDSKWAGSDGASMDEFSSDASLALGNNGEPIVAATFQQRVMTGSMKMSQLRVYSRNGNDWCYDKVADKQDGFEGGDGNNFTGTMPVVKLDATGHVYVLFHDRSTWHSDGMENYIVGQPRLAIATADKWTMTTLFPQPGQTESSKPLHGFGWDDIAVTPDGSTVVLFGVQSMWDTDSMYNNSDMPITYNLIGKMIGVTLP